MVTEIGKPNSSILRGTARREYLSFEGQIVISTRPTFRLLAFFLVVFSRLLKEEIRESSGQISHLTQPNPAQNYGRKRKLSVPSFVADNQIKLFYESDPGTRSSIFMREHFRTVATGPHKP
jgi:hypothetical protein